MSHIHFRRTISFFAASSGQYFAMTSESSASSFDRPARCLKSCEGLYRGVLSTSTTQPWPGGALRAITVHLDE